MLRLIIKDCQAYWHLIVFQLLIVIGLMSFGLFIDQKGTLTFVALLLYPLILPTILLINDQKYFALYAALPNRRSTVVVSKYVGGLIIAFVLVAIALAYGYMVTTWWIKDGVQFNALFSSRGLGIIVLPIILFNGLTFPVFFQFSRNRGSMVLVIIISIVLLGALFSIVFIEDALQKQYPHSQQEIFPILMNRLARYVTRIGAAAFLWRIAIAVVVWLAGSMSVSLWAFGRKDIGGAS